MLNSLKTYIGTSCIVLLSACVSPVPKIDASPSTLAKLKTISILVAPEPKAYSVINLRHPAMAFGLMGALVAAADRTSKESRLTASYQAQGTVSFAHHLAERVSANLIKAGYNAEITTGSWQETDDKFELQLAASTANSDATLLIKPGIIGFVAEGLGDDYQTTLTCVTSLISGDKNELVYRGYHSSGWAPKAEGWKSTPSKKSYPSIASLIDEAANSASSLNEAGEAVADMLIADLNKTDTGTRAE
jgi:hypothetical protein